MLIINQWFGHILCRLTVCLHIGIEILETVAFAKFLLNFCNGCLTNLVVVMSTTDVLILLGQSE